MLSALSSIGYLLCHGAIETRVSYYSISDLERAVLDVVRSLLCSTTLFLLTFDLARWAIKGVMSTMFLPLDSKDEDGRIAADWIFGTFFLAVIVVSWAILCILILLVPVTDMKTLLNLRREGRSKKDLEAGTTMLGDRDLRDNLQCS